MTTSTWIASSLQRALVAASTGVLALWAQSAAAQDATSAAEPTSPHPTLESLSIVWPISGDADNDGVVSVRYRASGEASYREGLPLRRVPAGAGSDFRWPNHHSGSLFDLRPGTTYEIELSLADPDGGSTTSSLVVSTRPEPSVPADATERAVTPATFAAALRDAGPGDVLVLGAGSYAGFTVTRDGTAERPLVVRGTPGAVVMGEIRLDDRQHVFVEDLEARARVVLHGTRDIVLRRLTITTADDGVLALGLRGATYDSYVCDNVITGASLSWDDATVGADGANVGEGIQLAGAGNVICRNRVRGFRDCLSTLEGTQAVDQHSIDMIGNDLSLCMDDAIEADFTMGNVRLLRNRITSSFVGISGQPTLGGPLYAIRNVMFNVMYTPFKLHRSSVGDVALHNTVVKCGDALAVYADTPIARAYFRNNLFLGGLGGGTYGRYPNGDGAVLMMATADASCDLDYDGFGSLGTGSFRGRVGETRFASFEELIARTTEVHATALGEGVFAITPVSLASGAYPEREPQDLRLGAESAAIDRGVALANINDGYVGAAPDLGAYELGVALPAYGPRGARAAVCGDGVREDDEACDDGNTRDGDGCSARCTLEGAPVDAAVPPGVDAATTHDAALPPGLDGGAPRDGASGPSEGPSEGEAGCGCTSVGTRGGRTLPIVVGLAVLLGLRRGRRRKR